MLRQAQHDGSFSAVSMLLSPKKRHSGGIKKRPAAIREWLDTVRARITFADCHNFVH
jgi:hypothetical protein